MSIVEDLEAQIKSIQQRINDIQKECCHPSSAIGKEHLSISDGYSDKFVTHLYCGLCHFRWSVDGTV